MPDMRRLCRNRKKLRNVCGQLSLIGRGGLMLPHWRRAASGNPPRMPGPARFAQFLALDVITQLYRGRQIEPVAWIHRHTDNIGDRSGPEEIRRFGAIIFQPPTRSPGLGPNASNLLASRIPNSHACSNVRRCSPQRSLWVWLIRRSNRYSRIVMHIKAT